MSKRSVTVGVLIEYVVEGEAPIGEIGSAAVGLIPQLPQFHVKGTVCTPVAVGKLAISENGDA